MSEQPATDPHRFARPCPACGFPLPAEDATCPECGLPADLRDDAAVRQRKRARMATVIRSIGLALAGGMLLIALAFTANAATQGSWGRALLGVAITLFSVVLFAGVAAARRRR